MEKVERPQCSDVFSWAGGVFWRAHSLFVFCFEMSSKCGKPELVLELQSPLLKGFLHKDGKKQIQISEEEGARYSYQGIQKGTRRPLDAIQGRRRQLHRSRCLQPAMESVHTNDQDSHSQSGTGKGPGPAGEGHCQKRRNQTTDRTSQRDNRGSAPRECAHCAREDAQHSRGHAAEACTCHQGGPHPESLPAGAPHHHGQGVGPFHRALAAALHIEILGLSLSGCCFRSFKVHFGSFKVRFDFLVKSFNLSGLDFVL